MNFEKYIDIKNICETKNATLVAVSKLQSDQSILALYNKGQIHFGENYVQELITKYESLPKNIYWHFIGHLQSNKVKFIAPFVHLIHSVDSYKLLLEINKQAAKCNRVIHCLLQIHIAKEETKYGFNEAEAVETIEKLKISPLKNIRIDGLMGMASFTDNKEAINNEFYTLSSLFTNINNKGAELSILSMGMSGDYEKALQAGSTMIRIGSLLFGQRPI